MEYVRFGGSGLMVSRLCLGAMDFPLKCDMETTKAVFHKAFDNGINFIDNADAYGNSEEVMGEALADYPREKLVIATKCWVKMFDRPGGGGREGGGCSRRHIIQACEDSLRRLRTDYIDLYQLHHPDPITPVEETLSALDRLVRDGKVRHIGVANHYAWQMAHMLGVSALRNLEPITVHCAAGCLRASTSAARPRPRVRGSPTHIWRRVCSATRPSTQSRRLRKSPPATAWRSTSSR